MWSLQVISARSPSKMRRGTNLSQTDSNINLSFLLPLFVALPLPITPSVQRNQTFLDWHEDCQRIKNKWEGTWRR